MDKLEGTWVVTPCEPMWSARVAQAQRDTVSNQGPGLSDHYKQCTLIDFWQV